MVKTRSQKRAEPKKVPASEFKNNPNFKPVSTGDLKHSIKGKQFFFVKFQGTGYTHEMIQRFVRKLASKYNERKEAEFIQVSIDYDNIGYRSTKISGIDEDMVINDGSAFYVDNQGSINGFIIYLA